MEAAGAAAEGTLAIRTRTTIASTDTINEVVTGAGTGAVEEGITTTTTEDLEVRSRCRSINGIFLTFCSQTTGATTDTTTATAGIAVMVMGLVATSAPTIAAILQTTSRQ